MRVDLESCWWGIQSPCWKSSKQSMYNDKCDEKGFLSSESASTTY